MTFCTSLAIICQPSVFIYLAAMAFRILNPWSNQAFLFVILSNPTVWYGHFYFQMCANEDRNDKTRCLAGNGISGFLNLFQCVFKPVQPFFKQ
jgi:hypothetical protein